MDLDLGLENAEFIDIFNSIWRPFAIVEMCFIFNWILKIKG